MLSTWWTWIIAAMILAILEVFLPAQVLLGFAIGAAGVGLGLLVGIPGLAGSIPGLMLAFAVMSLIGWLVLRRVLGVYKGQVKVWERDVNED
ncbi:MAG: hypothetical protein HKP37_11585 [Boseongicola sp.]|nr:hypothetical protein [Boseongicola sp.]NNL19371.1 hypothetical protein [Boseongicola sp.]